MKSCLIIDDSRIVRKVARRIIEGMGFACEEADDGVQGLDQCKTAMPDAIILDWNLPHMNGMDFLKKLRDLPNGRDVKVIFCTTENEASFIHSALAAGANEYIMKPFDAEILTIKFAQVGLI